MYRYMNVCIPTYIHTHIHVKTYACIHIYICIAILEALWSLAVSRRAGTLDRLSGAPFWSF